MLFYLNRTVIIALLMASYKLSFLAVVYIVSGTTSLSELLYYIVSFYHSLGKMHFGFHQELSVMHNHTFPFGPVFLISELMARKVSSRPLF